MNSILCKRRDAIRIFNPKKIFNPEIQSNADLEGNYYSEIVFQQTIWESNKVGNMIARKELTRETKVEKGNKFKRTVQREEVIQQSSEGKEMWDLQEAERKFSGILYL